MAYGRDAFEHGAGVHVGARKKIGAEFGALVLVERAPVDQKRIVRIVVIAVGEVARLVEHAHELARQLLVEQREQQSRQQEATAAIRQDAFVREAQAELGAQLNEDLIKPV